jgi:16S rRNA (cytosine1402-N4)-methyltransferase
MRSPSTDPVGAPLSAAFAVAGRERKPAGTRPVEGLRMRRGERGSAVTPEPGGPGRPFFHRPVMVDEVVAALAPVPPGLLVDGTVGGGGHAAAVLGAHPGLELLGLDRDPSALDAARARLAPFAPRVRLVRARFDAIPELSAGAPVTAVLLDLGVSSPQLDRPERGFSYRRPGPLDMRMDPAAPLTAAEVVNSYPADRLAALFRANGEGRYARRIAAAIVAGRPFHDTVELAETVRAAIPAPARRQGGHPARRVFQALRVEVNGELDVLAATLPAVLDLLVPGGRLAVIGYHSGEDRLVKAAFVAASSGGCTCPPGLPCVCGAAPTHRLVFRGARRPSVAEVADNPRAESARLRVVERIGTTGPAGRAART